MPGDHPADELESTVVPSDVAASEAPARRTPDESTVGLGSSAEPAPQSSDETDLPRLQVGESLAGRFSILRFIARGGMGAVYEATDIMLKARVALKVIRGRIATDATAMERFRREVLLARRVAHPNVCKVYELYEATTAARVPVHFLTMELLEGETLARRMARQGRLTTVEALPLVRQMCEGLGAAHAEGVIHRDFKSSNVILVQRAATSGEPTTETTRVVITDFGVARAMDLAAEESQAGPATGRAGIVGTLAYMAPEQVTGGEVSPASDVYALGVVIYEMVTGKLPFAGDSPLASAARRLNEAAPRPEVTTPGLDKRWAAAITKSLARQPDRRFKSARDVIAALVRSPRRRSAALAVSAAALVLLLGAFALVRYGPSLWLKQPPRAAVHAAPRPVVAILGFRDELPSPQLRWLPIAVSELLAHELAAAEMSLRVIPTDRVAKVRRSLGVTENEVTDEKSRQRMQALLAANVLIYGNLEPKRPGSDDVRLGVHLLDAQTGQQLAALEEDLGPNGANLPEEVVSTGAQLRKALGVFLSQDELAALSASRVRNLDATQAYAQGVMALRRFEYVAARGLFEAALTGDSGFLDAQRRVVETWQRQGNRKKAREAVEHIRVRPNGLTLRQLGELDAKLLTLSSETAKGVEARVALFDATPDDVELGLDFAQFGRYETPPRTELAMVRRLRQLPNPASADLRIDLSEADAVGSLGETNRARELLATAASRAKELGARVELGWSLRQQSSLLWIVEARGVEAVAPLVDAERLFAEVGEIDEVAFTKNCEALLLTYVRPPRQALAALDETLTLYRSLGDRMALQDTLLVSAQQLWLLGELGLSQKRVDEARSELDSLGEPPTSISLFVRALLALEYADLGEVHIAILAMRPGGALGEASALLFESQVLREQDHLRQAREALGKAALLYEQWDGWKLSSAMKATDLCTLECDEGKPAAGLACLAEHPPQAGMGDGQKSFFLIGEATCKYQASDLEGAERAAREALSYAERFELFPVRILSSVELMRIAAARGENVKAISTLRADLAEAEAKHNRRLAFEVSLALGEVELKAGRSEGRARLLQLEQEAKSREFFRIARLAREELDKPVVAPRH